MNNQKDSLMHEVSLQKEDSEKAFRHKGVMSAHFTKSDSNSNSRATPDTMRHQDDSLSSPIKVHLTIT